MPRGEAAVLAGRLRDFELLQLSQAAEVCCDGLQARLELQELPTLLGPGERREYRE